MERKVYDALLSILKEELVPAMGCTEPISVAYCAALASETLGMIPESVTIHASANIIKNVKSVVVPNTGGLRGIAAAASAGIIAGDASAQLQVLAGISKAQIQKIKSYMDTASITVEQSTKPYVFDVEIVVSAQAHTAAVEIAGFHTNVIRVEKDGTIISSKEYIEQHGDQMSDRSVLSIERIVTFAETVDLDDVREVLHRQIDCNMAIAQEGLTHPWGASIGMILLKSYGNSVQNRAKAYAAAGSDARMNGCELPVVINSGSGNQGLTTSLPVIVYAQEMNASQDTLLRALVIANLVTIHLKTGIGRLSAYCGATSAGCGAGAGITYLYGGRYNEIAHTIVNAVAINSGMICDGAKASCAAKIASAVEAGLLGMQMQLHDREFFGGDGIVVKGVENTIRNVGELAREGMSETDRVIVELMIHPSQLNERSTPC